MQIKCRARLLSENRVSATIMSCDKIETGKTVLRSFVVMGRLILEVRNFLSLTRRSQKIEQTRTHFDSTRTDPRWWTFSGQPVFCQWKLRVVAKCTRNRCPEKKTRSPIERPVRVLGNIRRPHSLQRGVRSDSGS